MIGSPSKQRESEPVERKSRSPRKQTSPSKAGESPLPRDTEYTQEFTEEKTQEPEPIKLELEEFTKIKEPISVFKNKITQIIESEDKSTQVLRNFEVLKNLKKGQVQHRCNFIDRNKQMEQHTNEERAETFLAKKDFRQVQSDLVVERNQLLQ